MNWSEMVRYEPTKKVTDTIVSEGILNDDKGLDYLVLNTALECGRKDIADFCLSQNCKVNQPTRPPTYHNTPLHYAVLLEDVRLISTLIEKGALINPCNDENSTPLHMAFLKKNSEIMDKLLTAMETLSVYEHVKNKSGLTTLHIACTRNNTKVIKNLLKINPDLKDSVSDESLMWKGFTALHFAAEYRSLEAMKILVSASSKSDREKKNGNGQTAFQMINQQLENSLVMSDLLSLDTASNSYKNLSNFHAACARDDPEMVRMFLDKGAPINTSLSKSKNGFSLCSPMHFAVERLSLENVKLLLEKEVNLSKINDEGMTPLHQALYTEENGDRTPLVDSLYMATRNKEANPKDDHDLSYLHVACTRNDLDLVKQLLQKNVNVNSKVDYSDRKYYNYTPLHFATLYENLEMVLLLIDQGADVNACNGSHTGTPLLMAFYCGNKLLIDMLLNHGADPMAVRPADKETTLTCLIYGYISTKDDELLPYIEKLIMKYDVDVNARDHDGDTALHIACEDLNFAAPAMKLLLDFGADINIENDKGETPFMWAIDQKQKYWHRDNSDHLATLYNHVQKLKAFGLRVNPKNERCCEQLLKKRAVWRIDELSQDGLEFLERERQEEIEKMKKLGLLENVSLYDFVMLEPERYVNEDVAGLNFGTTEAVGSQFPIYGYLIKLQLRRIQVAARNREAVGQQVVERPAKRQRCE